MPLVSVQDLDGSAEYLDVAHLAEDGEHRGEGSGKNGTGAGAGSGRRSGARANKRGRRSIGGMTNGVQGETSQSSIDPDALVDVPAFSSRGGDVTHLLPGGISTMIAPRYLSRDSRPRPPEVYRRHDSNRSVDDEVSVMTLETCLRQMDANGNGSGDNNASGELTEREMALAAARGEYNAGTAAMSRQNSETQSSGGGGGPEKEGKDNPAVATKTAAGLEKKNTHGGLNAEEGVNNDDHGRSAAVSGGDGSHYHPLDHHHRRDTSGANSSSRSNRLHHRSTLQNRYSASASNRSNITRDTTSRREQLNRSHQSAMSMRTVESEASASVLSKAESWASHHTHDTRGSRAGLGAAMWSAKKNKGKSRRQQDHRRSRNIDKAREAMELALGEDFDQNHEKVNQYEEEKAEERNRDRHHNHSNEGAKKSFRDRKTSLADEVYTHSLKETIEKQRESRNSIQTKDHSVDTRPSLSTQAEGDGTETIGSMTRPSVRALRTALATSLSTVHIDDGSNRETDEHALSVSSPSASLIQSAASTISNLAREVSGNTKSNSTEGLPRRQSGTGEGQERTISDLKLRLELMREALCESEDQVAKLEGMLANVASDRDRAERYARELEVKNDALSKRVEEMERREFGRAMGMTTSRAGATSGITVASQATITASFDESDPTRDALKKNRAQPFRQGSTRSVASLGVHSHDIDLNSVVSGDGTKSTATGPSADEATATIDNENASAVADVSDNVVAQSRSLPSVRRSEKDHQPKVFSDMSTPLTKHSFVASEPRAPPAHTAPRKHGMFGLGRLMENLHHESFSVLETLEEENSWPAKRVPSASPRRRKGLSGAGPSSEANNNPYLNGGVHRDHNSRNGHHSKDRVLGIAGAHSKYPDAELDNVPASKMPKVRLPRSSSKRRNAQKARDTSDCEDGKVDIDIDPAEVADEISHKLSTDIRSWGNASNSRAASTVIAKETEPSKSASVETETTVSESQMSSSPPQSPGQQQGSVPPRSSGWLSGSLGLAKQRDTIMKLATDSIRHAGAAGTASANGTDTASVVSSLNLAMEDELGS